MRNHPLVKAESLKHGIGYDDAEDIVRGRAGKDPEAAKAVADIDAANAREKVDALAVNTDMSKRLGLTLGTAEVLVGILGGDAAAYTWLCRRVQLTIADGKPPAHDSHPENA